MSGPAKMTWFYAFCRGVLAVTCWIFFGLRCRGREFIPKRGGCIIASSHASFLDPVFLAVASPRMLCFLAKEELFKGVFGVLIRHLNAFPVRRGATDVRSLRRAIAKLKQGHVLIIFPEGTRSSDGRLGTGQPGIGMLAERAGVPVIPAYIEGSQRAWPANARWPRLFVPVAMRFGPAIFPARKGKDHAPVRQRYQAHADHIIREIGRMEPRGHARGPAQNPPSRYERRRDPSGSD